MFGFGGLSEVFFILFLAMLIFGPEKLPEIGRKLAKGMAEVRKASNELKRTLSAELAVSEQELEARRLAAAPPVPPVSPDPSDQQPPAGLAALAVPAPPVAESSAHTVAGMTAPPDLAGESPLGEPSPSGEPSTVGEAFVAGEAPPAHQALETPGPADLAEPALATVSPMQPYGEERAPHGEGADADLS
jgi:TatA/E family protein of Tat protein translocase